MSTRQVLVIGLVLGVTAAAIVWWLERFEVARLHAELDDYLGRHASFTDWLEGRPEGPPPPPPPPGMPPEPLA